MTPLRLLQVEDTEDDAALVQLALTRAGFDVLARRVDTADELRRELHDNEWDLVIADYTMPGFSGTAAMPSGSSSASALVSPSMAYLVAQ